MKTIINEMMDSVDLTELVHQFGIGGPIANSIPFNLSHEIVTAYIENSIWKHGKPVLSVLPIIGEDLPISKSMVGGELVNSVTLKAIAEYVNPKIFTRLTVKYQNPSYGVLMVFHPKSAVWFIEGITLGYSHD